MTFYECYILALTLYVFIKYYDSKLQGYDLCFFLKYVWVRFIHNYWQADKADGERKKLAEYLEVCASLYDDHYNRYKCSKQDLDHTLSNIMKYIRNESTVEILKERKHLIAWMEEAMQKAVCEEFQYPPIPGERM